MNEPAQIPSPTTPAGSGGGSSIELALVVPVYNEQASIRKVISEWHQEVADWTDSFRFVVVNDGSTDGTPRILDRMRASLGDAMQVIDQPNTGHGQACLRGYRAATDLGAEFVLQIDSDGQCDPQYFFRFWRQRERFDVIYGVRVVRDDGIRRVIASWVLRAFLLVFAGAWVADANVPYRLMRTRRVAPFWSRIPPTFHLANIGLACLLRRDPSIRHGFVPIRFRERYGGEPSVALRKFGAKALELRRDLAELERPGRRRA